MMKLNICKVSKKHVIAQSAHSSTMHSVPEDLGWGCTISLQYLMLEAAVNKTSFITTTHPKLFFLIL